MNIHPLIGNASCYQMDTELLNSLAPERCVSYFKSIILITLLWRQNGRGSVSNHQPHDCLLNRLFRRRSKKTSKLRVTGLCARNSPGTGEFPAQMTNNAETVSIWWRHHVCRNFLWVSGECHSTFICFINEKSTFVQIMACCRQATSHYLSPCWAITISHIARIWRHPVTMSELSNIYLR